MLLKNYFKFIFVLTFAIISNSLLGMDQRTISFDEELAKIINAAVSPAKESLSTLANEHIQQRQKDLEEFQRKQAYVAKLEAIQKETLCKIKETLSEITELNNNDDKVDASLNANKIQTPEEILAQLNATVDLLIASENEDSTKAKSSATEDSSSNANNTQTPEEILEQLNDLSETLNHYESQLNTISEKLPQEVLSPSKPIINTPLLNTSTPNQIPKSSKDINYKKVAIGAGAAGLFAVIVYIIWKKIKSKEEDSAKSSNQNVID